jgi:hypothetical protein
MKRIIGWMLAAVFLAGALSGCIIVPDDGYHHHHHHDWDDRY